MATSRIVSRSFLSRGINTSRLASRALPSVRISLTQRPFSSSTKLWKGSTQTPLTGSGSSGFDSQVPPTGSQARSIALLKIPYRAVKSDIESLLRSKGFDVERIQLRLDRFTFRNDTLCFVELGSEQQAADAVQSLNGSQFQTHTIIAKPLKADFEWGRKSTLNQTWDESRYFYEEGNNPRLALQPLLEGRRVMVSVQTPGWGAKDLKLGARNEASLKVIDQYLGKYGIETTSNLHPFYGDKKANPRMICFLDFKTKNGANQAVQELHDTEVEGRRLWLQPTKLAPWRAHQIGKVDKALLAELQEKGLASEKTYEDKFSYPKDEQASKKRK